MTLSRESYIPRLDRVTVQMIVIRNPKYFAPRLAAAGRELREPRERAVEDRTAAVPLNRTQRLERRRDRREIVRDAVVAIDGHALPLALEFPVDRGAGIGRLRSIAPRDPVETRGNVRRDDDVALAGHHQTSELVLDAIHSVPHGEPVLRTSAVLIRVAAVHERRGLAFRSRRALPIRRPGERIPGLVHGSTLLSVSAGAGGN